MLKNRFFEKSYPKFLYTRKKTSLCKNETNQINEIENKNEEMIFEYSNLQGYWKFSPLNASVALI